MTTLEDLRALPSNLMTLGEVRDQIRADFRIAARFGPVEARIPDVMEDNRSGPEYGYFDDEDSFVAAMERYGTVPVLSPGAYITFNEIDPALKARASNRLRKLKKDSPVTKDKDVRQRRAIFFDFDADRLAGISATDAERDATFQVAIDFIAAMTDEFGWGDPLKIGSSGNGVAILYPIDEPNDAATLGLIGNVYEAVAAMFDTDAVKLDQSVKNAARIMKLSGTIAAKGDHTEDRPYRHAVSITNPDAETVTRDQLDAVAAQAPKTEEPTKKESKAKSESRSKTEEPRSESSSNTTGEQTHSGTHSQTDAQAIETARYTTAFDESGIEYDVKVKSNSSGDGTVTIIDLKGGCPFDPSHSGKGSIRVYDHASYAACFSASCAGKGWDDTREPFQSLRPKYRHRSTGQQQTTREDKSFIPRSELRNRPGASYLIPDFVSENALNVLSGPSGAGKTFGALAFAHAIATGGRVFGRQAKQGAVAYIAGEGDFDINERLTALEIHTGKPTADEFFSILDYGPDLIAEVDDIIAKVKALPEAPKLLIADTLNRTFTGEENSAKEMGEYVRALDRIRTETGASLLVIHHHGKSGSVRGSTALVAAASTHLEIEPTANDGVLLRCAKQKSRRAFDPIRLKKIPVALGEPTSILDVPIGDVTALTSFVFEVDNEPVKAGGLPEADREALQVLADAGDWISVREWEALTEIPRTSMQRIRDRLKVGGLIETQQFGKTLRNRITESGRLALDPKPAATVSRNPFAKKDEAA